MTARLLLAQFAIVLNCATFTGCAADTEPAPRVTLDLNDSLRVRRSFELEKRPDTLGSRVDTMRILGSPNAAVWLVVVSDFQCAACADFAQRVLPALRRDYVERGAVRLAYVNFPQDRGFNARIAAHTALCAASAGRFWAMHDSLFATLPRWQRTPDPQPFFDSMAVVVGVPPEEQRFCIERQRLLHLLAGDMERSRKSGVTEVPTVFIGSEMLSGRRLTEKAVRRALDEALARAR